MKTEITISEPVQIRKARSVKEIATQFHSQPITISEEVKLEPQELVSSFGKNFGLRIFGITKLSEIGFLA